MLANEQKPWGPRMAFVDILKVVVSLTHLSRLGKKEKKINKIEICENIN